MTYGPVISAIESGHFQRDQVRVTSTGYEVATGQLICRACEAKTGVEVPWPCDVVVDAQLAQLVYAESSRRSRLVKDVTRL